MSKLTIKELRGLVRLCLYEAVNVKRPLTPQQKQSFIELTKWAGDKMQAPKDMVVNAVEKAMDDNWDPAMELVQDYYILKGIKFNRQSS